MIEGEKDIQPIVEPGRARILGRRRWEEISPNLLLLFKPFRIHLLQQIL